MRKQGMDGASAGTNCGWNFHCVGLPGWYCYVPLLLELQGHSSRLGCCCLGPRMMEQPVGYKIYTDKLSVCWNGGIRSTVMLNVSRAWFKTVVLLKKSFQTSTGYVLWLFREHSNTVTKSSCERLVVCGEVTRNEANWAEHLGICLHIVPKQTASHFLGFSLQTTILPRNRRVQWW